MSVNIYGQAYMEPLVGPPPTYNNTMGYQDGPPRHMNGQNSPSMLYPAQEKPHPYETEQSYARDDKMMANRGSVNEAEEESKLIQSAMVFARHASNALPPGYTPRSLPKPVAVPQVSPKMGSPFVGAYTPELANHGIPMQVFVEFLDNFNVILAGSPITQGVGAAGQVLGFVPHHYFMLAGMAVQTAAGLATYAEVKTKCKKFVIAANEEYFAPRGLMVQVKKTEELARVLHVPTEAVMVHTINEGEDLSNVDALGRRLNAIGRYISPLNLNVPPPTEQTKTLAKIQAKASARKAEKMQRKTLEDREKAQEKRDEGNEKQAEELAKLDKEARKAEREFQKDMRKDGESKARKDYDKEMRKIDKDREKVMRESGKDFEKEDKEVKQSKKGLWIVVRNFEEAKAEMELEEREFEHGGGGIKGFFHRHTNH